MGIAENMTWANTHDIVSQLKKQNAILAHMSDSLDTLVGHMTWLTHHIHTVNTSRAEESA